MKKNLKIVFSIILLFFTVSCNKQNIIQKGSDPSTPMTLTPTLKGGSLAIYEAESLTATTSGQHPAFVQADAGASGGNFSMMNSTAVGEWIQYTINVATAGTYNIKVMSAKQNSRAICTLYLDGTAKSPNIDQYSSTGLIYGLTDFGDATLSAGSHTFKFAVIGKNTSSINYKLSFDYIDLTPSSSKYEAESLTVTTSGQHPGSVVYLSDASGGQVMSLHSTAVGEWIQFTLNVATAGIYDIKLMSANYSDRSICTFYLDGTAKTPNIDQYTATLSYGLTDMGNATLSAGNHTFKFAAIGKNGSSSGYQISFDYFDLTMSAASIPTLAATTAASAITGTTATSGGNVTGDGGAAVTARGVCWSTSANPTTANSKTTNGTGTGTFTSSITGLTAGALYYVRAYATNSAGTGYGTQISFTTVSIPTLAATTAASAITGTTATSGGNVTGDGGASVTARGVCWSTSPNPTTANSKTTNGTGTGTFTSSLTGLTTNTLYYVRAYATNSAGTGYGTQISFTTTFEVNVLNTGATPNDGTDDTGAIQTAVNQVAAHGSGTVLVPDGTYMINALVAVNLASNMTFKMTSGAILKAIPNSALGYDIIKISGKTNVNVTGGKVQGERHQHLTPGDYETYPDIYGQWGYGIDIGNSSYISVTGVTATECWGDGFLIGEGAGPCSNITLDGVVADDNRRQGCSITWADGVLVQNSTFKNTNGHAPKSGMDIEPDPGGDYVRNVQILNNQFNNNYNTGLAMFSAGAPEISNITVTGNTFSGNWWGMSTYNTRSGITISNNTIISSSSVDAVTISGSTSINNTYNYNTISVSPTLTGTQAGIRFTSGATGNTAIHNTISGYPYKVKDDVGGNTISPNP
jgi:parallel beta-helix repeat protein